MKRIDPTSLLPTVLLLSGAIAVSVPDVFYPQPSQATLADSPKTLVDQTWQIVNREFVDRSFNQTDWQKVRQTYLGRSYSSPQEAYRAIAEMLQQLGDPYTRFLSPEAVKDLVNNVSGELWVWG